MIETKRLTLKKLSNENANSIYEYMSDYDTCKYLYHGKHNSLNDTFNFINSDNISIDLYGIFLKEDDSLIGHIGYLFEPIDELLWVLNKKYTNKGYAFEAANEYIKYLFKKYNFDIINGHADINNIGSIKLMERLGMTKYEITIREYPDDRLDTEEVGYYIKKNSL